MGLVVDQLGGVVARSETTSVRDVATERIDRRFSVPTHVLSRSVGDDTVLLDLQQDEYYALGPVGTQVWVLLGEGKGVAAIVDEVAERYGVEHQRVEADVLALLDDMTRTGVLDEV